jgi:hypothetical protein
MVGMSECHPFPVWQMFLFESFLSQVFSRARSFLQRGLFFNEVFSSASSFLQHVSDAAIPVAAGLVIAAGTQRANRGEIKAGSRLCLSPCFNHLTIIALKARRDKSAP